jgi:hypothetical protein
MTAFHVYIGGRGACVDAVTGDGTGGANGGGHAGQGFGSFPMACSGGGGTDIRTQGGDWDNAASLKSRIIVAGGGGGPSGWNYVAGGYGGRESGGSSPVPIGVRCSATATAGGTAVAGYTPGYGRNGAHGTDGSCASEGNGGGGGGWWAGSRRTAARTAAVAAGPGTSTKVFSF